MLHAQVPSSHLGFTAIQNLQEKHLSDRPAVPSLPQLLGDINGKYPFPSLSSQSLCLNSLSSVKSPSWFHDGASQFWTWRSQVIMPAAELQPGHMSMLQSSRPLMEAHKLTALIWKPFLDQALLETLDFLHFFHFPSVTWSNHFSSYKNWNWEHTTLISKHL